MAQTLLIEDLSVVGSVSLSIAMPVMAAFGIQSANLPSMLLSTHTGGFGTPESLAITTTFKKFRQHWQRAQVQFEHVLIGYLGKDRKIYQEIASFLKENRPNLVLLDPAFADQGQLYHGMSMTVVEDYLRLCKYAQVLLPNLTEACYLVGKSVPKAINEAFIKNLLSDLQAKTAVSCIAITGVTRSDKIGSAYLVNDQVHYVWAPKVSGTFFGTGDLFSSLVFGLLIKQEKFPVALKLANEWASKAVKEASKHEQRDPRLGVATQSVLAKILTYEGK